MGDLVTVVKWAGIMAFFLVLGTSLMFTAIQMALILGGGNAIP
jgi:hypothetical protein